MSILLSFNGSNYIIPQTNEIGWGSNLDAFFVAIPAGCLQKTGGSFTLTTETDFGANFGLKSAYLKSRTTNPALAGILRLANGDIVAWRDFANTANLPLSVNASNQLTFNGAPIALGSSNILTASRAVVTDVSGFLTTSTVTAAEVGYLSGVTGPIQTQFSGKAPSSINLDYLSDVIISGPLTSQSLVYNGVNWINQDPVPVSGGVGVTYYFNDTVTTDGNGTLNPIPGLGAEVIDTVSVSNATSPVIIEGYISTDPIGGAQIEAGVWDFSTYRYVSAIPSLTTISFAVLKRMMDVGTVTITGSGTSRTATISGSTPFVAGDANANPIIAGCVETPLGTFPISAFTSSSVVTITTPNAYVNEVGVSFALHRFLFNTITGDINDTVVTLEEILTVQPAFTGLIATDKLSIRLWASSTSGASVNVSFVHNGTLHYSHVATPLATRHNNLAGLDGGATNQFYHLSSPQHTIATQAASTSLSGYLTNTDWNTFYNKQNSLGIPISVSNGGTGLSALTAYAVICGGTTGTGVVQQVSGLGLLGQFLQSQGPGVLPQWANVVGTGTVNSANQYEMTYYAAAGNTVSGTGNIKTNAAGQLLTIAGTALVPAYSFIADSNTGIFNGADGRVDIVSNGVNTVTFSATSIDSSIKFQVPDGSSTVPSITFVNDPDTGIYRPSPNKLGFSSGGSIAFQVGDVANYTWLPIIPISAVDLGTGSAKWFSVWGWTGYFGTLSASRLVGATAAPVQIETAVTDTGRLSITQNCANLSGPVLAFGKSRGTTTGSNTLVVTGDELGSIAWYAADGTDMQSVAASIACKVDGIPGANDTPGRLVFNTTPDGSSSPLERMVITSSGIIGINTTTPLSTNGGLDVSSGGFSLVIGADTGTITRTNNTNKTASISMPHYTSSTEEPTTLISEVSSSGANALRIGGGIATQNACSFIDFYTGNNSTTLTGTSRMTINLDGVITQPYQPCFRAYVSSTASNVTGNNTVYTVIFGTKAFDIGSHFNTGTGVYTAAVTGKYFLSAIIQLSGLSITHTRIDWSITTTSSDIKGRHDFISNPFTVLSLPISGILEMNVSDSAVITVTVYNSTKVVNIIEGSFTGSLIS